MTRRIGFLALSLALFACSEGVDDSTSREFSGLWLYEFEGSTFLEGAREVPKEPPPYDQAAWLDYHPDQLHPGQHIEMSDNDYYDEGRGCYLTHPFLVKFRGRKTTDRHGAGHLGLWASEVKVDRMISAERLGAPFCYGS